MKTNKQNIKIEDLFENYQITPLTNEQKKHIRKTKKQRRINILKKTGRYTFATGIILTVSYFFSETLKYYFIKLFSFLNPLNAATFGKSILVVGINVSIATTGVTSIYLAYKHFHTEERKIERTKTKKNVVIQKQKKIKISRVQREYWQDRFLRDKKGLKELKEIIHLEIKNQNIKVDKNYDYLLLIDVVNESRIRTTEIKLFKKDDNKLKRINRKFFRYRKLNDKKGYQKECSKNIKHILQSVQ